MTWEYIAGFFDGEGSLTLHTRSYRISIPQTSFEVLDAIKNHVQLGQVMKVGKRKAHWKETWVYYICKQNDVYSFLNNIKEHTIVKRSLVETTLPKIMKNITKQDAKKEIHDSRASEVKRLRSEGYTFREIGARLGIDFGYARKLILEK